jgi:hypothetical protein
MANKLEMRMVSATGVGMLTPVDMLTAENAYYGDRQ